MKSNNKGLIGDNLFVKIQIQNSELEGVSLEQPSNVTKVISENLSVWEPVEDDQTPTNPWDRAHMECSKHESIAYAEPNLEQNYIHDAKEDKGIDSELEGRSSERSLGFDEDWSPYNKDIENNIWHLGTSHSQLAATIEEVTSNTDKIIRIAHIDTGYDPNHITFPKENIRFDMQRNFVDGEDELNAVDPLEKGKLKQPGHGAGTLGVLAGKAINQHGHTGPIGLTKNIEIVPLRIAESVVLVKTAAFVQALQYIISLYDNPETRIHVVTMSMGGSASNSWKEMINLAYEKGIFIVTAAGNNMGRKTPKTLVHPARFKRVVAACGVTHDFEPYRKKGLFNFEMQGNFGPRAHMSTAMAAFTPNLPWALAGTMNQVTLSGAGTSSATPQIAMAAALYYLKHFDHMENIDEGWKRVETLRHALFSSALKWNEVNEQKEKEYKKKDFELYFGNGILQAKRMLGIPLAEDADLTKMEEDTISFPFFKVFFGFESSINLEMLELEMVRIIQQDPKLQELLNDEEVSFEDLDKEKQKLFLEHVTNLDYVSNTLKDEIKYILKNIDL